QTLARVAECNKFQDAHAFLLGANGAPVGQRGRQRSILREGVYAINLALFVVITEDVVYRLNLSGQHELETLINWQNELRDIDGFSPVVVGKPMETVDPLHPEQKTKVDSIAIVTVHDGPSL